MMTLSLNKNFAKKAAPALLLATFLGACAANDCETTVISSGSRGFNGNDTTAWMGNETMVSTCRYEGDTPPANWNAPQHLQHMQKGGTPQTGSGGTTGWRAPQ